MESGIPNAFGLKIPVKSNWNLKLLDSLLVGHPRHKEIVQFMTYGWPISFKGESGSNTIPDNHKGAIDFMPEIREYIKKEMECNAVLGPLETNPFGSDARVSPLNTRPKPDGSRRVILNLSHPIGNSVNSGIAKKFCSETRVLRF